jgi:hypothetical protein
VCHANSRHDIFELEIFHIIELALEDLAQSEKRKKGILQRRAIVIGKG